MKEKYIFHNVILDQTRELTIEEKRFYSCVRLVADQCTPAVFYLNSDWCKLDILQSSGIDIDNLNSKQIALLESLGFEYPLSQYDQDVPKMVYISKTSWEDHFSEKKNFPVQTPNREFILSKSSTINKLALEQQGLTSRTAILCLAAVGINIMLPNISFDLIADEEIELIRETLIQERIEYLNSVTRIADESYERLNSGKIDDVIAWASDEVDFKLAPKARVLEENIAKVKQKTLRQAGYSFWQNSIPAIGKGYMQGGLLDATKITAEEALKFITLILTERDKSRKLPEVGYALRIIELLE